MDKKGFAKNLVDLSDLDTEVPLSKNEAPVTEQKNLLAGSMITNDPDFIDIFSDEI